MFTSDGYKQENKNVQAINECPQPTNVRDLQCLLGMVNYINKYSTRLTQLSDSLRELTKKNVPFRWEYEHTEAFDAIKKEITSAPYSNIMTPKIFQSANRCKPRKPPSTFCQLKSPATPKYICCNWTWVSCSCLGHGEIPSLSIWQKVSSLKHLKSLKIFLPRATLRLKCLLTRTLTYYFNVGYINGLTKQLADCF